MKTKIVGLMLGTAILFSNGMAVSASSGIDYTFYYDPNGNLTANLSGGLEATDEEKAQSIQRNAEVREQARQWNADNIFYYDENGNLTANLSGGLEATDEDRAQARQWSSLEEREQARQWDADERARQWDAYIAERDGEQIPFTVEPDAEYTTEPNNGLQENEPLTPLKFVIGSSYFQCRNEVSRYIETAPFIHDERTMLPLRVIAEALGAFVYWNFDTRTVTIVKNEETITLTIDVPLPDDMGTPVIVDGFTFVPVRYIAETLGATVQWDEAENAVYIYE